MRQVLEDVLHGRDVEWFPEVVALPARAAGIAQLRDLVLALDALRHDVEVQAVREPNDGKGDSRIDRTVAQAGDQRAVDLQLIDRKSVEVAQRGVAGTE